MPYDFSFNQKSLDEITRTEIVRRRIPFIRNEVNRQRIIAETLSLSQVGFQSKNEFIESKFKNKKIFKASNISGDLALYKATKNLKELSKPRISDRDSIVESIKVLLEEEVPYKIYRLDIKDFYESVDAQKIFREMCLKYPVSVPTKSIVESAIRCIGIPGLPRGLGLSAILSEFRMSGFDSWLKREPSIFYYCRFVDDIILITNGSEDEKNFFKQLVAKLGEDLTLNKKKSYQVDFNSKRDAGCFEYLGYVFHVTTQFIPRAPGKFNPDKYIRKINLDISSKKIKKIQSKVVRAMLAYRENGDFSLLKDRIAVLASNFIMRDKRTGFRRKSGIYYSYKYISYSHSVALKKLDKFLVGFISRGYEKLSGSKKTLLLSRGEKKQLLDFSFDRGFRERKVLHFTPGQLINIYECWRYE